MLINKIAAVVCFVGFVFQVYMGNIWIAAIQAFFTVTNVAIAVVHTPKKKEPTDAH